MHCRSASFTCRTAAATTCANAATTTPTSARSTPTASSRHQRAPPCARATCLRPSCAAEPLLKLTLLRAGDGWRHLERWRHVLRSWGAAYGKASCTVRTRFRDTVFVRCGCRLYAHDASRGADCLRASSTSVLTVRWWPCWGSSQGCGLCGMTRWKRGIDVKRQLLVVGAIGSLLAFLYIPRRTFASGCGNSHLPSQHTAGCFLAISSTSARRSGAQFTCPSWLPVRKRRRLTLMAKRRQKITGDRQPWRTGWLGCGFLQTLVAQPPVCRGS
jgi:hypothetical protein